jgi:Flp pilus assembly protein TadB
MIIGPPTQNLAMPVLALAAATLLARPPVGRMRLRALWAAEPVVDVPVPVVRPGWVAAAAVAAAATGWAVAGPVAGVVLALVTGAGLVWLARRGRAEDAGELELAGRWELLAVCLRAGMPVAAAVAAGAEPLTSAAGARLRRVAGLLALGADPVEAWSGATEVPALAAFARAAARSAGTGSALAQVAEAEGARLRASMAESARARAEKAGVMITGPLGLCFLPAFLVLGIGPVVIGLAGSVLSRW